jgi:dCTP deaminase
MTIKPDSWIRKMAVEQQMIDSFSADQVRQLGDKKVISYGLSSYGYDFRCTDEFKLVAPASTSNSMMDPKSIPEEVFHSHRAEYCLIPPHSFVLTSTVEYFRIPDNVLALCFGKSTYARCGIFLHACPIEPGWQGNITLELTNNSSLPAKIYAHEGIGQIVFLESDQRCDITYADRKGKYQNQTNITHAKI